MNNKKIKIQIFQIDTRKILFENETENNTIKDTVERAVALGVDLEGANLNNANLEDANLSNAKLKRAYLIEANLSHVNLCNANLYNAYLENANLYRSNLMKADLRNATLNEANLKYAFLNSAELRNASLLDADLSYADLYGVNLLDANINYANLYNANFRRANVYEQNFYYSKNIPYFPLACPSDGAFVGWKKVKGKLIKLQIPEDAKRSSASSSICRCDKALVLAITDIDGKNPIDVIVNESYEHLTTYKVGKMVFPDSFNDNRWEKGSNGIHFFINKQDAINY
mgnify:CR=1 FL=1